MDIEFDPLVRVGNLVGNDRREVIGFEHVEADPSLSFTFGRLGGGYEFDVAVLDVGVW